MPKDDFVRIRHILDAAREALSFASGKTRGDLNTDRMLALSLVKEIEIIGEAAAKVSVETRQKYKKKNLKRLSVLSDCVLRLTR